MNRDKGRLVRKISIDSVILLIEIFYKISYHTHMIVTYFIIIVEMFKKKIED